MENQNISTSQDMASENKKRQFKFKGKKAIFLSLFALIVIAFIAIQSIFGGKSSTLKLNTHTIKKQNIENTISVSGTVSGTDSAEIGSSLNYEVIKINVKEGDFVKKGDVLAVLDSKDLSSEYNISVKEYEIAKSQNADQYESAKLLVKERELDYNETKRQHEMNKVLFEEGNISKDELIQSEMLLEKSKIALSNAQSQLYQSSPGGIASKSLDIKREMLNIKKDNLDKSNITSPINGTVTRVNAKLGRIPTSQTQTRALFIVEDLENLIINVKISEYDISSIKIGQEVIISSDMLKDKTVSGKITRIAPTGETVQEGTSTEMKIPVEITVENGSSLIAGVRANAKIILDKKQNIITVPIESIFEENNEKYILLGNDGVISKIKVITGLEDINNIEIISNEIKEGDIVITNPSSEYTDGQKYTSAE